MRTVSMAFAVIGVGVLSFVLGMSVDVERTTPPQHVCVVESHGINQPSDGGHVWDSRTTYTGDCRIAGAE